MDQNIRRLDRRYCNNQSNNGLEQDSASEHFFQVLIPEHDGTRELIEVKGSRIEANFGDTKMNFVAIFILEIEKTEGNYNQN